MSKLADMTFLVNWAPNMKLYVWFGSDMRMVVHLCMN